MDEHTKDSAMKQFCCSTRYRSAQSVHLCRDVNNEYMHVEDPVILAAFVAFCSGFGRRVFLRGCCQDYPRSFPSLFRDGETLCSDPKSRWLAYKCILRNLRSTDSLNGNRWRRENLGAVLQHYGIRTPWLDVVSNIYTATWFATHKVDDSRDPSCRAVRRNENQYGWISLYSGTGPGLPPLAVVDLGEAHSSQHVRPHAQHGLSLSAQYDPTDDDDGDYPTKWVADLNTYRIGRIRFPNPFHPSNSNNNRRWDLSGHMFDPQFLFPDPEHDDSLKQLNDAGVNRMLDDVCDKDKVPTRSVLGTVYRVCSVEENPREGARP